MPRAFGEPKAISRTLLCRFSFARQYTGALLDQTYQMPENASRQSFPGLETYRLLRNVGLFCSAELRAGVCACDEERTVGGLLQKAREGAGAGLLQNFECRPT